MKPQNLSTYYPMMLLKSGELEAIQNINRDIDSWYTPIFTAVPDSFWTLDYEQKNGKKVRKIDVNGKFLRKPKDYRKTIEKLADQIHENCRHEYPLMLDGRLLTGSIQNDAELHPIFDLTVAIRDRQLSVIPVTGLLSERCNTSYQKAIQSLIQMSDNRLCLRLSVNDLNRDNLESEIYKLLNYLKISFSDVYLLLDFGYIKEQIDLEIYVDKIPDLNKWGTVIIGAGAFPKNESGHIVLKANSSPRFKRHAFLSWTEFIETSRFTQIRKFDYADYTCRNPDFVPLMDMRSQPAAKVTWTLDEEFVHERGTQPKSGDNQFTSLAENLFGQEGMEEGLIDICDADQFMRSIFEGEPDRQIGQTHTFWISKGIEHHITLTVMQMHDLAGFGLQGPT